MLSLKLFFRDECGATAADYALILAIVVGGIALAISAGMNTAQGQL